MKKPKAPKVAYTLLTRDDHKADYQRLDTLIHAHHDELRDARIALAWCSSWRADADGIKTLGRCKRASALDRELVDFDFVILLNEEFWKSELTENRHREALLDHELCHATLKEDSYGEPVRDARGRLVYRTRKHDIEEFACIPERHGLWKHDLERFAQAIRRADAQPKLPIEPPDERPAARTH